MITESFGTNSPGSQLSESKEANAEVKRLEAAIQRNRTEWREAERRCHAARMNSVNVGGPSVDLIKLKRGDLEQRELYDALRDQERASKSIMDKLDEEKKELERQLNVARSRLSRH